MRARLIVFPIRGRNWCFSRSIDESVSASATASQSPSTFKEVWNGISISKKPLNANAELLVDFISNKMNKAWAGLEKAPDGTFKNKIHGLGLKLLSRVKPSEIFLKSISKDVTSVEVIYPSSLNARLVHRRLRHIAMRGTIIHKKYFYGSISLLPVTSAFSVLPLPNIPFFWNLFRTYSHWRALQGSEKLFQLVSDGCKTSIASTCNKEEAEHKDLRDKSHDSHSSHWVLQPSKELDSLAHHEDGHDGLSQCAISNICRIYYLNPIDVIKYKDSI